MKLTRNLFFPALGLSLATCITVSHGQTKTWDGGSSNSNNWSGNTNAGERNWTTDVAPVANDSLIFAGNARTTSNNNFAANTTFGNITFNNTAGAFTLTGNAITLGGNVTNDDTQNQTINMAMILSGNRTFNANAGDITVAVGGISGSGFGIIKTGNQTLNLNVSNAYTGTTDIQAGTLALGASNVFADLSALKISGGILDTTASNRTDTVSTFEMTSGSLNGGGTITATTYGLSGGNVTANLGAGTMNVTTGTVNLNGTSAATAVNINSGTLALGANDRLANGATVAVAGGILDTTASNRTDAVSIFNMSSGSLNGGGTITATTYGLSGGTVTGNLGTGTMNVTTGTVNLNGTSAATAVNVNSGTLALGANDRLDNGATVVVAGGILDTTALNRIDTVSIFNMSSGSLNGGGTITATTYGLSGGNVTANLGAGTMNVTTGTVNLTGTSAATAVNINSGTLSLGANDRLANGATVAVAGGILALAGNSDTVGAVSLTNGSITGSGGTLTGSSYAVQSGNISAKLGGSGVILTKTTGGTVVLSAANTYTGDTVIKAGTLELASTGTIASTNIIVGDTGSSGAILGVTAAGLNLGATQRLSGIGTINGSTTIQGIIAPGDSVSATGTLTIDLANTSSTVTMASSGGFELLLDGIGGTITSPGLSDMLSIAGAASGDFAFNGNNVNFLNSGAVGFYKLFDTSSNNANTWTGLSYDPTSGLVASGPTGLTYTNLTSGLTGDFYVGTTSNGGTTGDIYFQVVPEPGAALLGGLGTLLLLRRRRA